MSIQRHLRSHFSKDLFARTQFWPLNEWHRLSLTLSPLSLSLSLSHLSLSHLSLSSLISLSLISLSLISLISLSLISLSHLSLCVCLSFSIFAQRSNLTSVSDVDGSEYIPTDDGYEGTTSLWLCECVCVERGGGSR